MAAYLNGRRCRRVVLDGDMDGGSTRTGCRTGEQFCDVCRGESRKRIRSQTGPGRGPGQESTITGRRPDQSSRCGAAAGITHGESTRKGRRREARCDSSTKILSKEGQTGGLGEEGRVSEQETYGLSPDRLARRC